MMKNEMAWMAQCSGAQAAGRVQCFIRKRSYRAPCVDWNGRAAEYFRAVADDRYGLRRKLCWEFCVGSDATVGNG